MTQPESNIPVSEIELRVAYVENALRPGGVLHGIAASTLTELHELSPSEAGDVIMPPKVPGEKKEARFQLIENAPKVVKAGIGEHSASVLELADRVDMRRPESIDQTTLALISPTDAVVCIEGGSNRTSVVRRALAIDLMTRLHKDDVENQTVYQLGADRVIQPTRRDGSANPEYGVAQEITGDHFPEEVTEFSVGVASALQAGFEVTEENGVLVGRKANAPVVVFIQHGTEQGLKSGFSALKDAGVPMADRQLVIATNGQYRPKDELQAMQWAAENGMSMLPPVAVGDEAGYMVEHAGATLTTANRGALAYANEMVVLNRLASR